MNEDVPLKTCGCGRAFYAWVADTAVCIVCAMKGAGLAKERDEEERCDHSPAAWRDCVRCSDAEGDIREHEERGC